MSKKLGEKSESRKNKKSIKKKKVLFTLGIAVFMALVTLAAVMEMSNYEYDVLDRYDDDQNRMARQLGDTLSLMYSDGRNDQEIIEYMDSLESSGSRFYVLTKENEVIFARDIVTTKGLGALKDKSRFYDRIEEQEVSIASAVFRGADSNMEIAVISDIYTVKADMGMIKHSYYVYMILALICLIMLAILEIMLGVWGSAEKKYINAQDMLERRNQDMEDLSEELMSDTSEGTETKSPVAADNNYGFNTGIETVNGVSVFNVFTMRDLMVKSKKRGMENVHMMFFGVIFDQIHISRDQMFKCIQRFKEFLGDNEVLGRLRGGVFVVFSYKADREQVTIRYEELVKHFDEAVAGLDVGVRHSIEYDDGRNMVAIMDSYTENGIR